MELNLIHISRRDDKRELLFLTSFIGRSAWFSEFLFGLLHC